MKDRSQIKIFLAENGGILTAVGILGTLIGFVSVLQQNFITHFLNFFLFLILLLIWTEIDFSILDSNKYKNLFLKTFFYILFLLFTLHVLLSFRVISWNVSHYLIWILLMYFIFLGVGYLDKKFPYFEKIKENPYLIGFVISVLIFSQLLALLISIPLNLALDELDHIKSEVQLY